MTDDLVWIHRDPESVVKLVLNRPAKANALTGAMLDSLCAAVTEAGRSGARALVLTGNGKVFSAGADLGEAAAGLAVSSAWERLSGAVADLPCLTVAALNGTIAGGANGMALACDIRIAVPEATFFYPVMRLGYLPPDQRRPAIDWSSSQRKLASQYVFRENCAVPQQGWDDAPTLPHEA